MNKKLMFIPTSFIFLLLIGLVLADPLYCNPWNPSINERGITIPKGIVSNATTAVPTDFWIVDKQDETLVHLDWNFSMSGGAEGNCSFAGYTAVPDEVEINSSGSVPYDFWISDSNQEVLWHLNNTCHNHDGTIGNFSMYTLHGLEIDGFTTNVTNGAITDWWVVDSTNDLLVHLNASGHMSSSTWGNFSTLTCGVKTAKAVAVNVTSGRPDSFWFFDGYDNHIAVCNGTGHSLFNLTQSKYGFAVSEGMYVAVGGRYIYTADSTSDDVHLYKQPILYSSLSGLTYTNLDCDNQTHATLFHTGFGSGFYALDMGYFWRNTTFKECSYGVSLADNITITNQTGWCEVNFTVTAIHGAANPIIIAESIAITFYPPTNIPATIALASVITVIVIYTVIKTKKYD